MVRSIKTMGQDRTRVAHALVLLAPALLLGLLIGAQAQSQSGRPIAATRYSVPLVEAAVDLQAEQQQLKDQLADLRTQLDAVGSQGAALDARAATLHEQVDALRAQAGLTALTGAGVTVTLDDARLSPSTSKETIVLAIVHSSDITDVFNAAWKAGATGMAVNGERVTGSSACVGAVIQLNGTLLSPPFVISIVGPADRLFAGLSDPRELRDLKQRHDAFGLGFEIRRADALVLPPYTGPIRVRYATLAP
ncbi:MAG TPA: DUF881 domain-containing protein [Candidatus Limnocylindria bacterium]|nr:DUF881 domain-containing protein [Candidatus Limnocylindria bacterium]